MEDTKKGFTDKAFFRPGVRSNLIRKLIKANNISQAELAEYLNCNLSSLRNKFSRDAFSLYDLIITCYVCNCTFAIMENDDLHDIINDVNECIDTASDSIYNDDYDNAKDAIDSASEQISQIVDFEYDYVLSPEEFFTEEEYKRIEELKKNRSTSKRYDDFIESLSPSAKRELLERLKNSDKKNP